MRTPLFSALVTLGSLRAARIAAPVLLAGASLIIAAVAAVVPVGARAPFPLVSDDVLDGGVSSRVGEDRRVELAVLHRALVGEVVLATAAPAVGVEVGAPLLLSVPPAIAAGAVSCARWSSARRVTAISGIVRPAVLVASGRFLVATPPASTFIAGPSASLPVTVPVAATLVAQTVVSPSAGA